MKSFNTRSLAAAVVRERVADICQGARVDIFGVDALHGATMSSKGAPYECRVRMSVICGSVEQAEAAGDEVIGLYNNGPAGGGGARTQVTEQVGVVSTTIDRSAIHTAVTLMATS